MASRFIPEDCAIPTIYCGDAKKIPSYKRGDDKRYTRRGSPQECLSKGFGAGMITERLKSLPDTTLQQIKYVGDVYDKNFGKMGIKTVDGLVLYVEKHSQKQNDQMLKKVLTKKGGSLDLRAYNSVLLFLHRGGSIKLPKCQVIP